MKCICAFKKQILLHLSSRINTYSYSSFNDRIRKDIPNILVFLAGIFTERLGLGTKGFFAQHRKNSPTNPTKLKPDNVTAMPPQFQSHPSIESTNTISNSSLQDLDETEFTGTELARYMGELNFELVT